MIRATINQWCRGGLENVVKKPGPAEWSRFAWGTRLRLSFKDVSVGHTMAGTAKALRAAGKLEIIRKSTQERGGNSRAQTSWHRQLSISPTGNGFDFLERI